MKREIIFLACGTGYTTKWDYSQAINRHRLYHIHGGTGYYTVNGITQQFRSNHIYFLSGTVEYSLSQDISDPLHHTDFDFASTSENSFSDIIDITEDSDESNLCISSFLFKMVPYLLSEHYTPSLKRVADIEYSFKKYGTMFEACMIALLNRLEEKYSVLIPLKSEEIQQAISYIHSHYSENIDIHKLASLSFLSEKYFIKKFHEVTNQTPYQYLQNIRYDVATTLISYGITTSRASEQVGFSSPSSFYRIKKKRDKTK